MPLALGDPVERGVSLPLMSSLFVPHALMHLSALIAVAALALRDQFKLRVVLLVSIVISACYNAVKSPPDPQAMMWNGVSLAINIALIARIVLDRSPRGMSEEDKALFDAFQLFTPGEFRAIMKLAAWRTATDLVVITQAGIVPGSLYYILDGDIEIDKGERHFQTMAHTFIGEIAFLHGVAASATVSLAAGSRYVEWPVEMLRHRLGERQRLRQALIGVISFDMAAKVARA